jgi:hypothetical protein
LYYVSSLSPTPYEEVPQPSAPLLPLIHRRSEK